MAQAFAEVEHVFARSDAPVRVGQLLARYRDIRPNATIGELDDWLHRYYDFIRRHTAGRYVTYSCSVFAQSRPKNAKPKQHRPRAHPSPISNCLQSTA